MKVQELLDILSRCNLDAEVYLDDENENISCVEYVDPQLIQSNIYNFKGVVWISNKPNNDDVFKVI
ncbi:MAG TPA: hypothetical protein V6C58_03745 [Allocoleopsis sp.]